MRVQGPVTCWAATHTARFATGQLEKSTVTFPTPAWPTVRVSGVERWPAVPVPSTVRKYTPGSTAPSRLSVTGSVKLVRVRLTVVVPVAPGRIVSADGVRDSPSATIADASTGSRVVTKTWNANVVTVVGTLSCHCFELVVSPDGSTAPSLYRKYSWLAPVNVPVPE